MVKHHRIHPTSYVSDQAELADDVTVGPFSVIEAGTRIGPGSRIGSHCLLGVPSDLSQNNELIIGENANIRSHSIFYTGSVFGTQLVTGHRVTVRENVQAGENLQIGTLSDLQGHCTIGNYVRFHSNVHIGQKSSVGDFVWIFPYVVLTNDPSPPSEHLIGTTIGRFSAIATMSVILPGISVGEGALVGASALVRENVPDNMICVGNPGKIVGHVSAVKLRSNGESAYPWRRHFHRGYPAEIVQKWKEEFSA